MRFARGAAGALFLAACGGPSAAPSLAASDAEYEALACRIETGPVDLVLRGDSTITLGEPGGQIVRDSRGRYFAGTRGSGEVMVWAPDGRLLQVVGRPGEGPGELARGTVVPFIAPGDTLFARDNHLHWVVFDSAFRFVRNAALGPVFGGSGGHLFFRGDGRIVSTFQGHGMDSTFAVTISDHDGRLLRGLGGRSAKGRPEREIRPLADAGDGTFWVGPPEGPALGYRVERWDTAGRVLETLRRDVPWFPAEAPRTVTTGGDHGGTLPFNFPTVVAIYADTAGRVWVITVVPVTADAAERYVNASLDASARVAEEVLRLRVEVFAPGTRRLLAGMIRPVSRDSLAGLLAGEMRGFRYREDAQGLRRTELFPFRLVGESCR